MNNLVIKHRDIIPADTRKIISKRYHQVTKAINKEFWKITNDTKNSLYVGSYGRGTAINTSDLDILVCLPESEYNRHDSMKGNGQSRLLQSVKNVILTSYPRSDVRADGQIIKINFSDGIKFEILPAFKELDEYDNWKDTYKYPDSNMGGRWKSTNPKAEQNAMKNKNRASNGLLFDTCKHIRSIRDNYFSSYHLSGIVIDSFVYEAIGDWTWGKSEVNSVPSPPGAFEQSLLTYYNEYSSQKNSINAPGSNDTVLIETSMDCLQKVLNYIVK